MNTDLTRVRWRKSSKSQNDGQCVELGNGGQLIRDSKNPRGGVVRVSESAARSFLALARTAVTR